MDRLLSIMLCFPWSSPEYEPLQRIRLLRSCLSRLQPLPKQALQSWWPSQCRSWFRKWILRSSNLGSALFNCNYGNSQSFVLLSHNKLVLRLSWLWAGGQACYIPRTYSGSSLLQVCRRKPLSLFCFHFCRGSNPLFCLRKFDSHCKPHLTTSFCKHDMLACNVHI